MDDEETGSVNISVIIHATQSSKDQTYLCLRTPSPASSNSISDFHLIPSLTFSPSLSSSCFSSSPLSARALFKHKRRK